MGTIFTLKTKHLYSLKSKFLTFFIMLLLGTVSNAQSSGEKCFIKKTNSSDVNVKFTWTYNASSNTYTVRATLSKGFVDNTYGNTAIGWPKGHKFSELVGSDNIQMALTNGAGSKVLEFKVDYLSEDKNSSSGYTTKGVTGGDGKMITGNSSNVVRVRTSLDENLKICPSFTTNSPATDANYSPSAQCPGWDYNVWYEVEVNASAFGTSGFGAPSVTGIHASPSKTGNNSETVEEGPCPGNLTLGNQVWDDVNNNGLLDNGEKGISGLVVKLYKDGSSTAIASTTTDANGFYYFSGLGNGNYFIGVVKADGYGKGGTTTTSANPDNNVDNDNNGTTESGNEVRTPGISLSLGSEPQQSGNSNFTLDVGMIQSGNIPTGGGGELCYASPTKGDCVTARVQHTSNANNTVTIRVIFSKCFVDNTYGTNAVGWPKDHKFSDMVGSDHIQMALLDANNVKRMDFKLDYISSDKNTPSGYRSLGVTGGDGKINMGSASDVVSWKTSLDANFNDHGYVLTTNSPATDANYTPNPAYPNWIYDVWYEVTVNASAFGSAGFGKVLIPSVHASPSKTGSNTESVEPADCPSVLKLGNLVFEDKDGNGVFNAGDAGVAGATVKLYKANNDNTVNGAAIATTQTNSNGHYQFTNLAAGNYIVGVTLPSGFQAGATTNTSSNPNNDIDNDNNGVRTVSGEVRSNLITLTVLGEPNASIDGDDANGNMTLDFGLENISSPIVSTLSLGDQVWDDLNSNGVKDANEPGVNGLMVRLYTDNNGDNNPDGNAIVSTITSGNGNYYFNNLQPGKYIVGVVVPTGYVGSAAVESSLNPDNNVDNDNNGITTLPNNEVISRYITLSAGDEPSGSGNANYTLDFGIVLCGSLVIGDYVWEDTNGNGIQDADEYGIPNSRVVLTLSNNTTRITFTNADGYYYFTGLLPGTYKVCFDTPDGYRPTTPNAGADDRDSDPVNGCVTVSISGSFGTTNTDAGFVLVKLNLGDRVFNDLNENGIRDAGEPGIAGLTINLYRDNNGDNKPDGIAIATTTTDADGKYNFSNLTAGRYIVGVKLVQDVWQNGPIPFTGIDPDNNIDNDNNGLVTFNGEVFTRGITLSPGAEPTNDGDGADGNLTLDIALIKCPPAAFAATLGNKVFSDENNNGRFDIGEPGIPGLVIKLYVDANGDNIPDGQAIATTTTSNDGTYLFTNLDNGRYIVGVVHTNQFKMGAVISSGQTPDNDIDGDNNGVRQVGNEVHTNFITLLAGTEPVNDGDDANGNLTLDFGLLDQSRIVLPVTLVEFSGSTNGSTSRLKWKVANESLMEHYIIEKSLDGRSFSNAGTVNSLNGGLSNYDFNDINATNAPVVYFRLRLVNQSGTYSYSNVLALRFGNTSKQMLTVYPNPARDYTVLNISSNENSDAKVQVFNATGQMVLNQAVQIRTGSNAITLDGLDKFVNGTYTVILQLDNGERHHQKVLIMH